MTVVKDGVKIYGTYDDVPAPTKDYDLVVVLKDSGTKRKGLYVSYKGNWYNQNEKIVEYSDEFINLHNDLKNTAYADVATMVKEKYPGLTLLARPITGKVAEQLLNVDTDPNEGEINITLKDNKINYGYMIFFLDDIYYFTIYFTFNDTIATLLDTSKKPVDYIVIDTNDNRISGTCNYCFASSNRRWNVGDKFSTDDGGWAVVPDDLDFDSPGPYLNNYSSGAYGFGNINSNDNSANKLYIDGQTKSGTVKAFIYVKLA